MSISFYFSLMLASGLGAVMRYGIGRALASHQFFAMPIATGIVNLLGCFVIGYLAAYFADRSAFSPQLQTVLISGFLGGFTTFSAFSLEALHILQGGAGLRALLYVGVQVTLCLLLCFAGFMLAKHL